MTKILAIDDKEDNLISLSAILRSLISGCTVITALSGMEGIEKAKSESPDTILLDIKMAGMDGYETCKRLKENKETKDIPVIMISAILTESRDLVKGLDTGADAYLAKPIDEHVLIAQVKTALRMKTAEDSLREERDSLERLVEERSAALVEEKESARDFLENVINSIADPVFVKDDKRRFVLVNEALCTIVGRPKDGLIGEDGDDMFPKGEVAVFRKMDAEVLNTGLENLNEELLSNISTGEARTIITRKTRYINPEGNHFLVGVIRDITEQKKSEIETIKEKQKAESYLNLAGVMFIGLDKDGNINVANKKACQILEVQHKDILGQNWFDNYIPQSIRHDTIYVFDQLMDGTIESVEYHENCIVTKSGKEKEIAWHNSLVRENNGNIIGTLASGEDITEKKQLQIKLQQAQKMESIGTLAGGIAHDFNNILSSIIGFTELALDGVDEGSDVEDDLHEVRMAGLRAKDLVKQILAFARQSDEVVKPVQVNYISKEVLKFIKSSIPSNIQINNKIYSDSFVMGSPTQIHQVLMNLCTNAAQAMEENGGILEVSVNDITIDKMAIPDLKPGEYIEIKVTDTGEGISPQHIHTIFEPYFTTKPVGEGTGMGLAVVHGIVENYGGKITANSTIGKGTCFTIYLPITKKRKVYTRSEKEDLPLGNEKILLVDDEAPIAKMGSKVLKQLGYSVTTRTSSVEALELFRSKPQEFDLVVTDMTMPNMTGDKLTGELIKIRPDISVILCTGYSKKISEESAADIGIKALVYKPVVKLDLAKTVRKVLDETKSSE